MKRLFDILISVIGLLFLLPLFTIIGLTVALTSKGGAFYKQTRVGKGNIDFDMLKFRTMYIDSDKGGNLITVGNRDSRITKTGYFLRKYKIDELPQLWNVLVGDMSLVGPRPEVRKYVDMYNSEQLNVLSVKPGITDRASIEYSNENELLGNAEDPEKEYIENVMPAKLEMNLAYIKEKHLFSDIKIIIQTIVKIAC